MTSLIPISYHCTHWTVCLTRRIHFATALRQKQKPIVNSIKFFPRCSSGNSRACWKEYNLTHAKCKHLSKGWQVSEWPRISLDYVLGFVLPGKGFYSRNTYPPIERGNGRFVVIPISYHNTYPNISTFISVIDHHNLWYINLDSWDWASQETVYP